MPTTNNRPSTHLGFLAEAKAHYDLALLGGTLGEELHIAHVAALIAIAEELASMRGAIVNAGRH